MLTDSGVNAMSDNQLAAMMQADDAYAGSESFYRWRTRCRNVFGLKYTLPVHQGRAAEHLLAKVFIKPGSYAIMNYHFTTSRAHVELAGGTCSSYSATRRCGPRASEPFKGNMDLEPLQAASTGTARRTSATSAWRPRPT
jgi:tyrosine phenol-lyase